MKVRVDHKIAGCVSSFGSQDVFCTVPQFELQKSRLILPLQGHKRASRVDQCSDDRGEV